MDATYASRPATVETQAATTVWTAAKHGLQAIVAVLAEGARGDEFSRLFATPASAQFAALPRGQQSKALDHGTRPLSG
jgi:hypothetical protein